MSGRFPWAGKVAIAGYAHSRIERRSDQPLGVQAVRTCLDAISDAGLQPGQIDGFTTGALLPSSGDHVIADGINIVTSSWMAEQLGIHPRFASGFHGYGQLPGSVILAVNAIVSGSADYVLVHRAMGNPGRRYNETAITHAAGDAQWRAPFGLWGALAGIALPYQEYLQRYGARREDMAAVVVEARNNGAQIPWSYWCERPITTEDYLDSRVVADPMAVLDCDIPVDGVAAFILTSADRARDLPHNPVYVAGYSMGHPIGPDIYVHTTLDQIEEGGAATASRLWEHAGLAPGDVDVPQIYDGFAPLVWFWLEALGYCDRGEAHRFVQDGRIGTQTGLPILSGGGALGNGRMHGVPQMLECYLQLSGRAGERALPRAEVGLACHAFPQLGGAVVYTSAP